MRKLALFSPPERKVVNLICKGLSNRQIAQRLRLSVGTVKLHVHHILQAGKESRYQLKQEGGQK
jgi:two-component system nitrate/nitrite response regulator NarL